MSDERESAPARREAMRTIARWTALAGLAGLGAAFLRRRGGEASPSAEDHRCGGDGYCRACPDLHACFLPQASSARRVNRKEGMP